MKTKNNEIRKKDSCESYKHNAKLLLKIYRKVSFHVEDRIQMKDHEIYASRRQHLEDLVISFLEVDSTVDVRKLEECLIDVNISLSLLELMDLALERLSRYPNDGELFSDILWHRYFAEEVRTCEQLLSVHNMSRSTYFRYLNKATQAYGNMLFGYALPEIIEALKTIHELPMVAEITQSYET
ncbi:hypothetical protein [Facklamia sp. P12955]|uniref:hypothetical protein n=1 Tax=Facklamia sp. P12955 TaxID=3421946 RepID=UPI003D16486F